MPKSRTVLIVPDKFKGTLTSAEASRAIARGWAKVFPRDRLQLLPMSDGGDGFGEVFGGLLNARIRSVKIQNAAGETIKAAWWWNPRKKIAIVESAQAIGLAQLPAGKFHPFELDTFGLGELLLDVARVRPRQVLVGIGGSATNDAGFGMALALGWRFLDEWGEEILEWIHLSRLQSIHPPDRPLTLPLVVASDVNNPLLGPRGASRVYGPQKGLKPKDFPVADQAFERLVQVLAGGKKLSQEAGAGAAGGLGFGLRAFADAQTKNGFELFAHHAGLLKKIANADLVITGEGSLDSSTLMGKGVGEVARQAQALKVPVIGLGGVCRNRIQLKRRFTFLGSLAEITSTTQALREPRRFLNVLSQRMAKRFSQTLDGSRPGR